MDPIENDPALQGLTRTLDAIRSREALPRDAETGAKVEMERAQRAYSLGSAAPAVLDALARSAGFAYVALENTRRAMVPSMRGTVWLVEPEREPKAFPKAALSWGPGEWLSAVSAAALAGDLQTLGRIVPLIEFATPPPRLVDPIFPPYCGMVGAFTRALSQRTDLRGTPFLRDWNSSVRRKLEDAAPHSGSVKLRIEPTHKVIDALMQRDVPPLAPLIIAAAEAYRELWADDQHVADSAFHPELAAIVRFLHKRKLVSAADFENAPRELGAALIFETHRPAPSTIQVRRIGDDEEDWWCSTDL